ncbi:pentatricopeptide repeat-containing protein [Tanacetum coccineum]
MLRAIVGDTSLTRSYIPKVSQTPGISPTIANFYKPIEDRCIHEGRVVDQLYYTSNHIDRCFSNIRLNCLYEINEPIVPRFILDFYSQVTLQRDDSGFILISFMIQNEFITLSLAQFGQILRIPYNGQAVFTNEWDLSSLAFFQETEGPYHTDLPTPEEIHQFLQFQRVESNRTIKSKTVTLSPNQVLTKELRQDLKRWEELIRENVFGLGGHRDHLPACLAHILYCILAEQQYNLAYFFVKRIESARATPKAHLPYAWFLTQYGIGSEMTSCEDIYNFGILLLEVMTGKKPTDGMFNEGLSLHKFAYMALPDHVIDVIDNDAIVMQSTEANAREVEECLAATIKIGVSCFVDSPPQRMKIEIVINEL